MPLYEYSAQDLLKVPVTTLSSGGLKERSDLQRLLRDRIQILGEDLFVLAEEFGAWDVSQRRIDLLAVDQKGDLVVIELKRDLGAFMDLQALRYAAMISTMTFEQAVEAHSRWLHQHGREEDARERILSFLNWEEPDDTAFAQSVRIMLVSAEFSRELTTTVLWLIDHGLDIRCIRLLPYRLTDGRVLLDVQPMIPLPEAAEYQVRLREKEQKVQVARRSTRDFSRFDVRVGEVWTTDLSKRKAVLYLVRGLVGLGIPPKEVFSVIREKGGRNATSYLSFPGDLGPGELRQRIEDERRKAGRIEESPDIRWFLEEDELMRHGGETHILSKMWGGGTRQVMDSLVQSFPTEVEIRETVSE